MDNRHDSNNKDNMQRDEQLSLESILAEYKSEAYAADDKVMPENILDELSASITLEAISGSIASSQIGSRDNFKSGASANRQAADRPILGSGLYSNARAWLESETAFEPESKIIPEEDTLASEYSRQDNSDAAQTDSREDFDVIAEEGYSDFPDEGYAQTTAPAKHYDYYGGGLTYAPESEEEQRTSLLSRLKRRLPSGQHSPEVLAPAQKDTPVLPDYSDFLDDTTSDDSQQTSEEVSRTVYSSAEEFLDASDYDEGEEAPGDFEPETEEFDEYIQDTEEYSEEYAEEYSDGAEQYAARDYSEDEARRESIRQKYTASKERNFLKPLIALIAAIITLRHSRSAANAAPVDIPYAPPEEEELPEVSPAKAAKHYSSQIAPLKLRGTLAAIISVVMIYVSLGYEIGFPLPSALSGSIQNMSGLCLVMLLSVIMLGLDIFTNGVVSLLRLKPRAETLVALSCIISLLDSAFIMLFSSGEAEYIPFCAVSALSMAFSILGSRLLCSGLRASFRTAASGGSPQIATGESGISEDGAVLMRTRRGAEGFVRAGEEADCGDTAYSVATPFFIVAVFVLSLLAAVHTGLSNFLHILSAVMGTCASFSCLMAFSLPFSAMARRLLQSGAALAGWAGTGDIGRCRGLVVTDTDIFPPTAITIDSTRILEGMFADKVISYTGSLLAASGAGVSAAFTELMRRNGYTMYRVDDFSPREGGGLVANILGEQVYVGSSGFMQLMGIRMPRSFVAKNVVFTAISGNLVGIFHIGYNPLPSAQRALVALLQAKGNPYFAIRDFNITPQLISEKFNLPAESFEFPAFEDRYRLSAAEHESAEPPAAVLSRDNLSSIVETFSGGKRLFNAARLCVALSLLSSIVGMLLMFFLCWTGAFDSASVGNMVMFMLLWLAPIFIITLDLSR